MVVNFFFIASIVICLIAIPFIIVSRHKQDTTPFISLIFIAALTALYQWFNLEYYYAEATSIETLSYLKILSTIIPFAALSFFYIFATWTQLSKIKLWFAFHTAINLTILVANFSSDFSYRFELIEGVNTFNSLADLQHTLLSKCYFFYGLCLTLWAITRIKFFYQQKLKVHAYSLIIFTASIFCTIVIGFLIDNGQVKTIYLTGFPLSFLVLIFTINIAYQVKLNSEKILKERLHKEQIETAITSFAQSISSSDNLNFYEKNILIIQQLYKTKYALIGLYVKSDKPQIKTISLVKNGKNMPNFSYYIANTPCADVLEHRVCIYENNVAESFPEDKLLTEMNIKSYIGLPLFGNDQKPLGLVALMDDKPYAINQEHYNLLNVFGSRIGAELSRDNLNNKLKQMAYYDHATNLPNRAKLLDEIHGIFQNELFDQSSSILLLIDLDRFKDVNRIYGYDTVESILKTIGERLKNYSNNDIFIARNDGDEFAVLIKNAPSDLQAHIKTHWNALSAIIQAPITLHKQEIKIECSIGAVAFPLQVKEVYSVIRCAESALQQAKDAGRNQYAIFDPKIQQVFERKHLLLKLIKNAIEYNQEVFMVYQPQTDAKGNVIGAEALMRWNNATHGFITPNEFIPLVEKTELIYELGNWVFTQVLSQIHKWQQAGHTLPDHISINVAAKQLLAPNFVENLLGLCSTYKVDSTLILLELTESSLLLDIDQAIVVLKQLQNNGFRIGLDDFGTGYSSLSYLQLLPINVLKVDKSFVDEIATPSTKQLLKVILSISTFLNLDVIVEGTETASQVEELSAMGYQCFQGYYFSKPVPAEQFITWQHKKDN